MKSLEKAVADYEKAKEKMEASRARYEADLKRFKAAEAAKTKLTINGNVTMRGTGNDQSSDDFWGIKDPEKTAVILPIWEAAGRRKEFTLGKKAAVPSRLTAM